MSKELYDQLPARMNAELEQFRASLAEMGVQDVLAHATELAVKEQFVQRLESAFLSDGQIEALLKQDQPLQFMYENVWDQNHSSVISLFSDLAHAAGENARQEHPTNDRKYKLTDIAHPRYPWLHRIRALRDVGSQIKAGDLGGFVQSEDNLSQQGECWLFNNAIACEDALVAQNAQVVGDAVIRGSALVSGSAQVCDTVIVEDHAIVTGGQIVRNARISGNAQIGANQVTNSVPYISQDAVVYGEVRGEVEVTGYTVILPGMKIDMPTRDLLRIEDGRAMMLWTSGQMCCESDEQGRKPKHSTPER